MGHEGRTIVSEKSLLKKITYDQCCPITSRAPFGLQNNHGSPHASSGKYKFRILGIQN
jgi:hypothetical protein